MAKVKHEFYKVVADKINKKIVLISDLHYKNKNDIKILNAVLDGIKAIEPIDYICIAGDLLDQAQIKDKIIILDWFNTLAHIAPIIISLGNHDVTLTNKKREYYLNQAFIYELSKNKNIHILDNNCYVDGKIRFIGLTLPFDYYYKYKENNNYLVRYINNIFKKPYTDKYNILLCHSPSSITCNDVQERVKLFSNINLAFSGHTHGGLMPNFLKKGLKGKGLISPYNTLFPKNSYGKIKGSCFDTIISSGIQKIHFNNFKTFNNIFTKEITIIDINKK